MNAGLRLTCDLVAAGVALGWLQRALSAMIHLPRIPDVRLPEYDAQPMGSLTVVVPARDEGANIEATLRSLLAQDLERLQIVAVNDRSTDATGVLMEQLASEQRESESDSQRASEGQEQRPRLKVIHVTELPAGWVGKTHAMARAAEASESDWLLFTDGDVVFAPDALRRALVCAEKTRTDHIVLTPTMEIRQWDEGVILGYFQAVSLWVGRPWRIPDPKAKHDYAGMGAFNMVRREAYDRIGGFTALRMEVLEDVRLGILLKRAGFTQRMVFGRDLVRIHWATGAKGLLSVVMKNMFAVFRFQPVLLLLGCVAMLLFCVAPVVWLFAGGAMQWAGVITAAAVALTYRAYGRYSGISAWYGLLFPVAALMMVFALLRSTWVTWRQGGVRWRGTFYTLAELRRNVGPFL
ncbi:MAG TPA: glycosyltransferase family 2 protein [Acidobacteriaceae bacterium]